jgi:hypothetical protein
LNGCRKRSNQYAWHDQQCEQRHCDDVCQWRYERQIAERCKQERHQSNRDRELHASEIREHTFAANSSRERHHEHDHRAE